MTVSVCVKQFELEVEEESVKMLLYWADLFLFLMLLLNLDGVRLVWVIFLLVFTEYAPAFNSVLFSDVSQFLRPDAFSLAPVSINSLSDFRLTPNGVGLPSSQPVTGCTEIKNENE